MGSRLTNLNKQERHKPRQQHFATSGWGIRIQAYFGAVFYFLLVPEGISEKCDLNTAAKTLGERVTHHAPFACHHYALCGSSFDRAAAYF